MTAKIYVIPYGGIIVNNNRVKALTIVQHFEISSSNDKFSLELYEHMKTNLTLAKDYYFSSTSKQAALLHSLTLILGAKAVQIEKIRNVFIRQLEKTYSEKTVNHVKSMFDIHKQGYIIFRLLK